MTDVDATQAGREKFVTDVFNKVEEIETALEGLIAADMEAFTVEQLVSVRDLVTAWKVANTRCIDLGNQVLNKVNGKIGA